MSWVHTSRLHGRRGKGKAWFVSRYKLKTSTAEGRWRRKQKKNSSVAFLLCDPGWCVHVLTKGIKYDVQKKWDKQNKQNKTKTSDFSLKTKQKLFRRYFQHVHSILNSGCGKERRILINVHGNLSRQHPFLTTLMLRDTTLERRRDFSDGVLSFFFLFLRVLTVTFTVLQRSTMLKV